MLLTYLSKYPHVWQASYKPRSIFIPALQVGYNVHVSHLIFVLQAMGISSANPGDSSRERNHHKW